MNRFNASMILGCLIAAGSAPAQSDLPWLTPERIAPEARAGIIEQWSFAPGAPTPERHPFTLRGAARISESPDRGFGLEGFDPGADFAQAGGATIRNAPELTPAGAFTLEMWIWPKPAFFDQEQSFLLDKKLFPYRSDRDTANFDYLLQLRKSGQGHRIAAVLGYGTDSADYQSNEIVLSSNGWNHVAFTYDAKGRGRFFLNGEFAGQTLHSERGPVAPGPHPLTLGDRGVRNYAPFQGRIGCAVLRNGIPAWFRGGFHLALAGRTVFRRMESPAPYGLEIFSSRDEAITDLRGAFLVGDSEPIAFQAADLAAWDRTVIGIPVDTALKPGVYPVSVQVEGRGGEAGLRADLTGTVTIVARPVPDTMPVVMWGAGPPEEVREIGFTHQLFRQPNYRRIWEAGQPTEADDPATVVTLRNQLDEWLGLGLLGIANVTPGRWITQHAPEDLRPFYARVDRTGTVRQRAGVCGLFPEVRNLAFNTGASIAKTYGDHPALAAGMIHTEVRDHSDICYHEHDRESYRAHSGKELPAAVTSKHGVSANARAEQVPADGIVPDDHDVLDFMRWFWKDGDGWNDLHSLTHRGLKTGTTKGFWTYFDPAVRVPPVWGSGGEVDFLSQWTYSYPDPLRVGLATDQLFAMAAGRPGQQVMTMTQIIWYRNQTAPKLPEREEDRAFWEKEEPEATNATFLTLSPDHLRESFWQMLSRPVRGIMFHGWGSLAGRPRQGQYSMTHPGSKPVMTDMIRTVVEPLGPMLLQIPDPPTDVAMLESATSIFFGERGTWGWGHGWMSEMYQCLIWARLQPKVIYEDTILRDGLDGIRVLVLPHCAVLPRSVADRILAFQRRGGLVIGDDRLASAIQPDILIQTPERTNDPEASKKIFLRVAQQIREELASLYDWPADSSDPDVLVRRRRYGDADYLFVMNDRRKFGDYIGHHRRVMEEGLSSEAIVTLRRKDGVVYDLLDSRAISPRRREDGLAWPISLGPGEGRLYLVAPRAIFGTQVEIARRTNASRKVRIEARVLGEDRKPLAAVVPVQVEILDPSGLPAEFSGYYAVTEAGLAIELDLAENDLRGGWTVKVRERASGTRAEIGFEYR
ncbi:MAG: LamG-like jellyroll fold domain-containing protein [Kiritimatiellia bacterium]|nr:LamG-like jellyroll fold domain-containing protein [Kiritimatiellia bacterium]